MKKIGVFICHCGINIAGTVDVKKLRDDISKYPGVAYAEDYVYMCSEPGQNLIKKTSAQKGLEYIVVACCSPALHEITFRRTVEMIGLNPYQCEIANIREQCSWVHSDKEKATIKALKITQSMVEKVRGDEPLFPVSVPVTKKALVVGGGITGIQASLDIANAGYEVLLVEKNPSIGGHMIQLSETFPTLDCSQCILTPKMVEVAHHPNIKLLTYSEVHEISGYVGNFNVKIMRKSRYVIENKCTLCNKCAEVCPGAAPSEFDRYLVPRKAIYLPFPQAIPATYTVDPDTCMRDLPFGSSCEKECINACKPKAINFDMRPVIIEEKVGAIVVATGYDLYSPTNIGEYGNGTYLDVVDGLQFERLLSATGPTGGEVRRLSDGKVPKRVVFLSCVGSRDPEHHLPYCSKICCMYMTKHAMLYKHRVPDGEAIIFYIDIRSGGKGYEEFVARAQEEDKVVYIRGKVSKIFQDNNGELVVWGADTLLGKQIEIRCDMIVLSMAMVPSDGTSELMSKLKIASDEYGFVSEAHPKLRPVESISAGFFPAGCAQAPKDIPDAVAQASGAAAKVLEMFSHEELTHIPIVAKVDEEMCSGCGVCIPLCPYDAREMELKEGKRIAKVNEVLCEGCGGCISACPSGVAQQRNLTDNQILNMVNVVLK